MTYKIATGEPVWTPLFNGGSALFAPPSSRAGRKAYAAMRAAQEDQPDEQDEAWDAFQAVLIREGLRDWKGIADPFGPGAVDAFLADPTLFAAAAAAYVDPWLAAEQEKNGSSGSGNGTSAAPMPGKRTAAAAKPTAKTARTKSTPPKPPKAKPPGR